jgi:hypothetical protein
MAYELRLDFPQRGGMQVQSAAFNHFDPNTHSLDTY